MHDRAQPLRIEVTWDDEVATVTLAGGLDVASAPGMTERLMKIVKAHPKRLVLDLGALEFVDIAGTRALDRAYKALEAECPVIVRWPQPSGRRVFRLAGFMGS